MKYKTIIGKTSIIILNEKDDRIADIWPDGEVAFHGKNHTNISIMKDIIEIYNDINQWCIKAQKKKD
jgi:hypothetical protein